mmetsp:Transcript_54055/g.130325  ORF Transcript_54055/g.130325 Transcript_54055/m.130325 type:complete len:249 (+) Transcript_54055:3-749(+)
MMSSKRSRKSETHCWFNPSSHQCRLKAAARRQEEPGARQDKVTMRNRKNKQCPTRGGWPATPKACGSEPRDAEAPDLHQDLEACGQLPRKECQDYDVQSDVQVACGLAALFHEGHASSSQGPAHADGGTREEVWAWEELLGAEPSVEDAVDREEDAAPKEQGADLVVAVLELATDQLAALGTHLRDLLLQSLDSSGGFHLGVLLLGELLPQVCDLDPDQACLPPLPAEEAGVEGRQEEQRHDEGVHKA